MPSLALMEAAGFAVAAEIRARWRPRRVRVLCGPGNNGGDGFVVARLLRAAGWPTRVSLLGDAARLPGDAAENARRWSGPIEALTLATLDGAELVVDALFGAGLSRPVDGVAGTVLSALAARGKALPSVAVDVPSGLDGDTGAIRGVAAPAALTVTFFRAKPGHLLNQGPATRGTLVVRSIGIPGSVLDAVRPATLWNGPGPWSLPLPRRQDHKYTRGHGVVFAGATMTGAGRLAARAARRLGCGLLTIAAPLRALDLYALDAPGTLTRALESPEDIETLLADARLNALLCGPGAGRGPATAARTLAVLAAARPTVLDADALTSFADDPDALFEAIVAPSVLTPHQGEFKALFPDLADSADPLARARAAARRSGAVVVVKGAETIIAEPRGRASDQHKRPAQPCHGRQRRRAGRCHPWTAGAGHGRVRRRLRGGLAARRGRPPRPAGPDRRRPARRHGQGRRQPPLKTPEPGPGIG